MKFEEYVIGEIDKLCGQFGEKIKEASSRRSSTGVSRQKKAVASTINVTSELKIYGKT